MEFIKAAWPAIVCFFIMLTLSIVTFRIARRNGVDFVTLLVAFKRSLPHRWKMATDKDYRRRTRVIEGYEKVMLGLAASLAARNVSAELPDDLLKQAFGIPDDRLAETRRRMTRAFANEVNAARDAAARHVASLTDDDIAILAAYVSADWYDGRVAATDLIGFFRDERDLLAKMPAQVVGHLIRAAALLKNGPEAA
jgi:hypothetical protein